MDPTKLYIGSIINGARLVFYVAQVKGEGGKCWGWTDDPSKARPLSVGWVARLRAEARELGWRGLSIVPWVPICPECETVGGHDDNGAGRVSELSFCCCECGCHFDAVTP